LNGWFVLKRFHRLARASHCHEPSLEVATMTMLEYFTFSYWKDAAKQKAKKESSKLVKKGVKAAKKFAASLVNSDPGAFKEEVFKPMSVCATRYPSDLSTWKSAQHTALQRNTLNEIRNLNGMMEFMGVDEVLHSSSRETGGLMALLRARLNELGFQNIYNTILTTIDNPTGNVCDHHIEPFMR
jgi:hypothetical protein